MKLSPKNVCEAACVRICWHLQTGDVNMLGADVAMDDVQLVQPSQCLRSKLCQFQAYGVDCNEP